MQMDLKTHERKIFALCDKIGSREQERASDVGEDREEIGAVIELTGIHKKAFAFVRSLDKMEADKRNDVLRSLTPLLKLFEGRWNASSTPDMLGANVTPIRSERPVNDSEGNDLPQDFKDEVSAFEAGLATVAAQ